MNVIGLRIVFVYVADCVPHELHALSIWESVEDPIAAKHNKVMFILDFEGFYLWCCYKDVWISTELFELSFDIAKWPADW